LAADGRQQVTIELGAGAGAQDVARPRDDVLQGEGSAAELALHQRQADMVEPAAAELFRHVGRIEARRDGPRAYLRDQLRAHLVGALDLRLVRHELRRDEGADAVDKELLFGTGSKIHGRTSGESKDCTTMRPAAVGTCLRAKQARLPATAGGRRA